MAFLTIVSFLVTAISIIKSVTDLKINIQNGITIDFTIDYGSICQPSIDRFSLIYGVPIAQCLLECRLRKHCEAINFRGVGVCELFTYAEEGNTSDTGNCLHIYAKDIHISKQLCADCQYGEVCDVMSGQCLIKECLKDDLPGNSTHLGNKYAIGSSIRYYCDESYEIAEGEVKGTAVCLANGKWNASECKWVEPVPPCGQPSIRNASVSIESSDGTFSATVTCDAWYQTRKTQITCLESGLWENTTCEDCYLDTGGKYTGKRNTTATGIPCSRWDSPVVMAHGLTNLQYYPESSLTEAENYCRNPTSFDYDPWCYDEADNWGHCDVKSCAYY